MKKEKSYNRGNTKPGGQGAGFHGPIGMPGEKARNFGQTTRRLIKYLSPHLPILIMVVLFSIIVTVIGVIAPDYLRRIINVLQNVITGSVQETSFDEVRVIFLTLVGLYLIRFTLDVISALMGNYVSNTVGKKLRNQLRDKLEMMPIKYFDETKTGNILSVFSNDVETVSNSLQQSLIFIITGVLQVIGVLIMMFRISWQLTIIALITLPLYVLSTAFIAKKSQKKFKKQQAQLGNLNGYIEEVFTAHKVVKLFGMENDSFEEFQVINKSLANESKGAQFISGMIRPIMEFISNIGYVLIVVIGGILTGATHPLLIGDITIFVSYQKSFVNPILNIASMINTLQSTIAGAERVFELLDKHEELKEQNVDNIELEGFEGNVHFDHVSFSYKEEQKLIENLNLNVLAGKQIAIVGPTGAGKTTLVNLLMRFYEIQGGMITIDDVKYTDVPRKDLRRLFGMVLQDTWLFAGTIRENVAFGKADATSEEIKEACRQAHVDHFIETLPEGYETILNEDASNLSQGQKQLLTIARAILFNPKILILDEATSSVDTRTEAYIQNAMKFMMEGRTSFVIAHRLSTIKNASIILVMNEGAIVEQGNHKELLEKKGVYYSLYNSQFVNPIV
jgi:ATP-binding cassette, subfamily B, multidrug efflux pump